MSLPPTDPARKRLLYRATHRGTKEADFVVGGFFTARIGAIPENRLAEAEELLDVPDVDLMDWIMGRQPVPERWHGTLFADVMAYYRTLGARNTGQ